MKIQVPWRIRHLCDRLHETATVESARLWTELWWRARVNRGRAHGLPGDLVVSLTSYPPRYSTLAPTLKCLLSQTVRPDRVVLWIASADMGSLPREVRRLADAGLEIRPTPADWGSYKKIIPSVMAFPSAFVVTADDDAYYWPEWLEQLTAAYDGAARAVICHRAHRVRLDDTGWPAPYATWQHQITTPESSPDLFPTGFGGVLYSPGALPQEAADPDAFMALAPRADDLWLYWMARRTGAATTTLGWRRPRIIWRGSQHVALHEDNTGEAGLNDLYIARLVAAYGPPAGLTEPRDAG